MTYLKPSLALKLGISINKCIIFEIGEAVESQNKFLQTILQIFKLAFTAKWDSEISSGDHRTLQEKKWNKTQTLSFLQD